MFVRLVSVRVSAAPIIFEGCRRRSGQSCAEDVLEGVAGGVCVCLKSSVASAGERYARRGMAIVLSGCCYRGL